MDNFAGNQLVYSSRYSYIYSHKIKPLVKIAMSIDFLVFNQTAAEEAVLLECSNKEIYAMTLLEESQVNINEDHEEFFIFCMN